MSAFLSLDSYGTRRAAAAFLLTTGLALLTAGCSIKRIAVDRLGDALASGGTTWTSDDDPELVKAAMPFSLKLMETLLAESPSHASLLLATSSYFTQYSYAFVQQEADEVEDEDFNQAEAIRKRALRLYLRARDYALRGLETRHPGFSSELSEDPKATVRQLEDEDVPQLYWAAAAWGAAIALSIDNPETLAETPQMEALIDRALELDETWNLGAIHGFLITYEMSRQGAAGDPAERSRAHFERAMALADGQLISPLLAYAEAVCIQLQDHKEFEQLLNRALLFDPDEYPEHRLVNLIMQRRARWLLSRMDDLFIIDENDS